MTDKLTAQQFNKQIDEIGLSLDEKRWRLARLAWQAKLESLDNWASVMATNRYVKRTERTVREWAQVAELADSLPRRYNVPFTFYTRSLRYLDRLPVEVIMDALEQSEQDETTTAESFSTFLRNKANPITPPPFNLSDWLSGQYELCTDTMGLTLDEGELDAIDAVRSAVDEQRAKLVKAVTK